MSHSKSEPKVTRSRGALGCFQRYGVISPSHLHSWLACGPERWM